MYVLCCTKYVSNKSSILFTKTWVNVSMISIILAFGEYLGASYSVGKLGMIPICFIFSYLFYFS